MIKRERIQKVARKIFNKRIALFTILLLIIGAINLSTRRQWVFIPSFVLGVVEVFLVACVSFLIANIILRLTVERIFQLFDGEIEIEQRIFLSKIYSFLIYLLAIAVILSHIGVSVQNITLFLGLVTTGIALAVRDVLSSILVWLVILAKKPFRFGDIIKVGDDLGRVTRIGTFFITLSSLSSPSTITRVPNKTFMEKSIINHGKEMITKTVKVVLEKIPSRDVLRNITEKLTLIEGCQLLQTTMEAENGSFTFIVEFRAMALQISAINMNVIELLSEELREYLPVREKK